MALELPERIRSLVKVEVAGLAREEHDEKMLTVRRLMNKKRLLPADYDRIQRLLVIARRCCDGQHMLRDAPEQPDGKIPKLRELERTLHDLCLDAGRKVVVFSEWTSMTKRAESLCRRLGIACFHLHGGVPVKRRPALIRAFEQHRGAAVFLSTDAGGVGLNLQAAEAVVNLDLPWNPAKLEQRLARVHRIGSKKPVRTVLIVATDCVEDGILRLHDTKRNVLENVWATDGEDRIMAPGGSGAFRAMVDALLEREPLPPTMAWSSRRGTAEGNGHETPSPEPSAARAPTPAGLPASTVDLAALGLAVAQVAPSLPADHRQSLATVFRALAEALES